MCFTVLFPFFYQFFSSLCVIWCLSQLKSLSNPTGVPPPPFYFLLTTVPFSTFAFLSLPLPLMYFFPSVSVPSSLSSLCEVCTGTSQTVTLLLWPWAHCRVEMALELLGSDLSLFLSSQHESYLSKEPHFFSCLSISSASDQAQGEHKRAGVNWHSVTQNKMFTLHLLKKKRIQLIQEK